MRSSVWVRGLLVGALLWNVTAWAEPPRNQHLLAGIRLYADLDYEAALEQLRKAKADPANPVHDEVAIDFYEGMCLAALNRNDQAVQAFKQGLALEPAADLPERVSPKIKKIYEAAKADIAKATRGTGTANPTPDVPVAPPPPPPPPPVDVTPAGTPAATALPPTVEKKPESSGAITVAPWVVLGLGVVAGGTGAYFGVTAQNARSSANTPGTSGLAISNYNQTISSNAPVANVLFGAAGACAIAAVVLFIAGHVSESPSGASH